MKTKGYKIILLILVMSISSLTKAQDEKYGDHPEDCKIMLSTYTEFYKQENFDDAMTSWRWCFINCPKSSKNIYIHGPSILKHFIQKQTSEDKKQAYIDTLMLVFDKRIEHFDQKSMVLGRKGVQLLQYRPDRIKEAFDIFNESFELGKNQTESFILTFYMNTITILFSNNQLEKEKVVDLYLKISEVINYQIEKEANEGKRKKLEEINKNVEELFVNSGAADCETVIKLFSKKIEDEPENIELCKKVLYLLERGKSDECKLSDLYMKVSEAIYRSEKSPSAAHSIAQGYFKRDMLDKAEEFYNEAISLETDNSKKENMFYELALLQYSSNQYVKARKSARDVLSINPNNGKAYLLIGKVYSSGGKSCGETAFEKKSLNWLIVDQFIKAKNVDSSVSDEANGLISRFSAGFPTREEGFWIGVEEGQAVTINCWINESTTIRFHK